MRVLFTVQSIFQTMAPLAWALRTAGHEVCVAAPQSFTSLITQAGLTAVPVGRDRDVSRLVELIGMTPEMIEQAREGLPAPYDVVTDPEKATWEYMLQAYSHGVLEAKTANFPIIADLVEFARHWRPDLVIWEPYAYAGAIAAKACGAAHARLLWGVDVFGLARQRFLELKAGRSADPFADWLGAYARMHGSEFTEDLVTGHFTIDQFPRSLQREADLRYLRMRYVPYSHPVAMPAWLKARPERPRVALTMGLTATEFFSGYTFNLQDVLDALADLDIELVATIAAAEQAKLARVPANARLVPFVPLDDLAPTCSAVIHHAGAATLATTSLHPVPQLTLPYHFDEPIFAGGLAEQGAGLWLRPEEASGENVRSGVLRLLNEPSFRAGAARLSAEIRALPSPNDLVPQLEELTEEWKA